jgi:hypothetical protein
MAQAQLATPQPSINLSNPILQRLASGQAEDRIREAGAKGTLPLDRTDLARSFYLLSRDQDKAIRLTLKKTIDTYDEEMLAAMASDLRVEPPVLHFLCAACPNRTRVLEEVVLNASADIGTIQFLAQRADSDLLELISINEELLMRSQPLVEAMLANPALTPRVRLRLRELQIRHFGLQTDDKEFAHLQAEAQAQEERETQAALVAPPPPEAEEMLSEIRTQLKARHAEPEEGEDEKEEDLSTYARIKAMNTGSKILAAIREGRDSRMILVRDSNPSVQKAVVKSPKLTASEAEIIAQLRNVTGDVLAMIPENKKFRKSYFIVHSLIKNPLTPQHTSVNLMPILSAKDLQLVQTDKNIPEAVRKQAKFVFMRKTQPKKKH